MAKDLPLNEIALRKYEKPYQLEKRELVKKVCLSLGLLQPGDNRDIIVDILYALIEARKQGKKLNSEEIRKEAERIRRENSLEIKGLAESNVRRQLKRLRDFMLVDKQENLYFLSEFMPVKEIFEKKIESFLLPQILERVKEYLEELEKS